MQQNFSIATMMAQNVISFILLLTHLCSSGTAAWDSRDACSNASSATAAFCIDSDSLLNGWYVDLDYAELLDSGTLTITYIDSGGSVIVNNTLNPLEVRMICIPDGEGTNQIEAQVCQIDNFDLPTTGGPYTFSNLSVSRILPGWSCNISACFLSPEYVYLRTQVHTYYLQSTTLTTTISPTTTSQPAISWSTDSNNSSATHNIIQDATVTTTISPTTTSQPAILWSTDYNNFTAAHNTINVIRGTEYDDKEHLESLGFFLPTLIIFLITVSCAMLLTGIISIICIRRHIARKRALLMYNKRNMVFDPQFYPAVCIDKPTFNVSPGRSIISLNLLHSLDPTTIYAKEDHLNIGQLSFESDTDDSDGSSIDLSKSLTPTVRKTRLNDNICSTYTEIIAEPVTPSAYLASSCPQSDSACRTHSIISSEQGYVQIPHYQQKSTAFPSSTVTRLDCPSDDNDSVLTEVLSEKQQFIGCTDTEQQHEKHSASEYVQSSTHGAERRPTCEYVQSSTFSTLTERGSHSNGGYVQCNTVSVPTLLPKLSRELCDSTTTSSFFQSLNHTTEDSQETSMYFHPPNFQSDYAVSGCHQNRDTSVINDSDKACRVKKDNNSYSSSHVIFHTPIKTSLLLDNDIEPDSASEAPSPIREEPRSSSGTITYSSAISTGNKIDLLISEQLDSHPGTYGYLPSELLTRQILVPSSHDASPAAFVVQLDFEN